MVTDCRVLMAPTRRAPLRGERSWRRAAATQSNNNSKIMCNHNSTTTVLNQHSLNIVYIVLVDYIVSVVSWIHIFKSRIIN